MKRENGFARGRAAWLCLTAAAAFALVAAEAMAQDTTFGTRAEGQPKKPAASSAAPAQPPAPEPGTLALLGSSLLGFAALRRRRRQ